jgi:YD repeat-containing protein
VRVYDGGWNCLTENRTIYENLEGNYNSAPVNGLAAKTQQTSTGCSDTLSPVNDIYNASWAANWAETRMAYDGYGNPIVVHHVGTSSANDDHTVTAYDSAYHLFPVE